MEDKKKFYQSSAFLATKENLDRRSMSPLLWQVLKDYANNMKTREETWPRTVLDCGCGAGAMVGHLKQHHIKFGTYLGIDIASHVLDEARKLTVQDIHFRGASVYDLSQLHRDQQFEWFFKKCPQGVDLVCAQSLAEHVDLDLMLGSIWLVLRPGGILYAPINYDGETIFEPTANRAQESRLIENFNHLGIEGQVFEGQVGGDALCGRRLCNALDQNGFRVLAFDSEDWVIRPNEHSYSEGEDKFLEVIVSFVAQANLIEHPRRVSLESGLAGEAITESERDLVKSWETARLEQISRRELIFVCHQMGVIGEKREVPWVMRVLEYGYD